MIRITKTRIVIIIITVIITIWFSFAKSSSNFDYKILPMYVSFGNFRYDE